MIASRLRSSIGLRARRHSSAWNAWLISRYLTNSSTFPTPSPSISAQCARSRDELGRLAVALGREPSGDPLEGTADLDRVPDIGERELPHREAARRQRFEQALVCQAVERVPYGSPRSGKARGESQLGQTLSRREVAAQKHLAQRQDRALRLRRARSPP